MNLHATLGLHFAYKHHFTFIYTEYRLLVYYPGACLVRTFCSSSTGPSWFSRASADFSFCKPQRSPPLQSCLRIRRKEQVLAQMPPPLAGACSLLPGLLAPASTASLTPQRDYLFLTQIWTDSLLLCSLLKYVLVYVCTLIVIQDEKKKKI